MVSENKIQHLGKIYRLIEQFELISRTDLAKLSGLAPASITNFTKILIDNHFILERTVQNSLSRGRPAIGLAVSPFFWQLLYLTISPEKIEISLCELSGKQIYSQDYTVFPANYPVLDEFILQSVDHFYQHYIIEKSRLLAVSVSVVGKINRKKKLITQLGHVDIYCPLGDTLAQRFTQPILLSEHFQLWLLAESTVGSLISNNNVIFLQLDETVNLSVLLKGALLDKQSRMNVDHMLMPRFSNLSDEIAPALDEINRYQLVNQITFPAIAKLVDKYLPNSLSSSVEKIDWLCAQIEAEQPQALAILEHITDNLAYALMNLINIFSTDRIMLNSPLLRIKDRLFQQIQIKLKHRLLRDDLKVDLITSQYEWNSPLIACAAIKEGIYEGNLIKDIIS